MAKSPATEKTTSKPQASSEDREAPIIKTASFKWQSEGQCWREAFVRAPQGLLLDDLISTPEVWKNIQASPQIALRKLDRVTVIAFDETWLVKDVIVADADARGVKLALRPTDRVVLPITAAIWEDGEHRIEWAGSGYGVFRKLDGHRIFAEEFSSIDTARAQLFRQHYGRAA